MLSREELRRWFEGKKKTPVRDLKIRSMYRELKLDERGIRRWLAGQRPLPVETQRILSKFVEDWENGMLEFKVDRSYKHANGMKGTLVHRATPKPMPARFTVDIGPRGTRLKLLGKPERTRMPGFPEIAGKLTRG